MTWLVVGSGGQLGRALCAAMEEDGIGFCAWGTKEINIESEVKCVELITSLKPSVIINAAAWTDVDGAEFDRNRAHLVNTVGALNLAVAAKAVGAVFVQLSTDYVFSGVGRRAWQEHDMREPTTVYGVSKAAGEDAVLNEYADHSYIFRTAWLYSPWGKNFAKSMTHLALTGDGEVRVVTDQVGQPTSAIDLAEQIIHSVRAELPFGIYHATNSGQGSWFDFAIEVFNLTGALVSRLIPVSSIEFDRPAKRPQYSVLGHKNWESEGASGTAVSPMRNWRVALREAMPKIVDAHLEEVRVANG